MKNKWIWAVVGVVVIALVAVFATQGEFFMGMVGEKGMRITQVGGPIRVGKDETAVVATFKIRSFLNYDVSVNKLQFAVEGDFTSREVSDISLKRGDDTLATTTVLDGLVILEGFELPVSSRGTVTVDLLANFAPDLEKGKSGLFKLSGAQWLATWKSGPSLKQPVDKQLFDIREKSDTTFQSITSETKTLKLP